MTTKPLLPDLNEKLLSKLYKKKKHILQSDASFTIAIRLCSRTYDFLCRGDQYAYFYSSKLDELIFMSMYLNLNEWYIPPKDFHLHGIDPDVVAQLRIKSKLKD